MDVIAQIRCYINNTLFPYVSQVETKNDSQHIGSSCEITMPLNARVKYDNSQQTLTDILVKDLFSTGDMVKVQVRYLGIENSYHIGVTGERINDGDQDGWLTIFEGYLYDFYQGIPLKIKCLDGIYLANSGVLNHSWDKISLKDLIKFIIADTPLKLIDVEKTYTDSNGSVITNDLFDLNLTDYHIINQSPAGALEDLKKNLGINISLMGNNVYCNIASNTLESVKLDTSINVIKSNLETTNLTNIGKTGISKGAGKSKTASIFQKFKIKAWFIQQNLGVKDSVEVGDADGQMREVFFYKVARENTEYLTTEKYKRLAEQALLKVRQAKFCGTVETKIYPFLDLFWRVEYNDISYPDRNGMYVVTSINYKINEQGFNRTLKLAYLADML